MDSSWIMTKAGFRALCAATALIGAASIAHTAPPAERRAPGAQALRALQPGEWEVRGRGEDAQTRRLCISDLRQLLQLRHGRALCPSFTVADTPHALSVTYDCAAAGNGRTDLRVETVRLVQIRSQGIADGAPFAFDAEGRRLGPCRP